MKNNLGYTALMMAVKSDSLDVVKELDKVEGTDFRTTDIFGRTLIDISGSSEMWEFLVERNKKVERLKIIAAYSVAKIVKNKDDVEALDIPHTLHPLVAGFVEKIDSEEE